MLQWTALTSKEVEWKGREPDNYVARWAMGVNGKDNALLMARRVKELRDSNTRGYHVYDQVMEELTKRLNNVHITSKGQRYWEQILGQGVLRVVQSVIIRYHIIEKIREAGNYIIIDDQQAPILKSTFREVGEGIKFSHELNLQIFSLVAECTNVEFVRANIIKGRRGDRLSIIGSKFINHVRKLKDRVFGEVLIFNNGLGISKDQVSSYGWTKYKVRATDICMPDIPIPVKKATKKRNIIAEKKGNSDIEDACLSVLSTLIPVSYIEFYDHFVNISKAIMPDHVKCIVQGHYKMNPIIRISIARAEDNGAKIIGCQHGSGYGEIDKLSHEIIEKRNTDKFITWGWESSVQDIPSPSPKINKSVNKIKKTKMSSSTNGCNTGILWVSRDPSFMLDARFPDYLDLSGRVKGPKKLRKQLLEFASSLNSDIREDVTLRFKSSSLEYLEKDIKRLFVQINERFPKIKIYNKCDFHQAVSSSRIVVIDHYPSTSFLKCIAGDVPVLSFGLTPDKLLSMEALEIASKLKAYGVLYETPKSCANTLNKKYPVGLSEWWERDDLQKGVSEYARKFANINKKSFCSWASILNSKVLNKV